MIWATVALGVLAWCTASSGARSINWLRGHALHDSVFQRFSTGNHIAAQDKTVSKTAPAQPLGSKEDSNLLAKVFHPFRQQKVFRPPMSHLMNSELHSPTH